MQRSCRQFGGVFALLVLVGATLVPRLAWAPPICRGAVYHVEKLTLSVREATIDGAAATLPSNDYSVLSTCNTGVLTGELADPDYTAARQGAWVVQP